MEFCLSHFLHIKVHEASSKKSVNLFGEAKIPVETLITTTERIETLPINNRGDTLEVHTSYSKKRPILRLNNPTSNAPSPHYDSLVRGFRGSQSREVAVNESLVADPERFECHVENTLSKLVKDIPSTIKAEIHCGICFEVFDSPATIECGHTFCLECLKPSLIKCPTCRSPIQRKKFQVNTVLSNLIESMISSRENQKKDLTAVKKDLITCYGTVAKLKMNPHLLPGVTTTYDTLSFDGSRSVGSKTPQNAIGGFTSPCSVSSHETWNGQGDRVTKVTLNRNTKKIEF